MSARKISRHVLQRSALSLAVGMVLASGAQAQSNTAGAIFGKASPGDVIVIENPDTGFKREIPAGSDGSFRASSTPTGNYVVTVRRADGTTLTQNVTVNIGTGTSVNFAGITTLEGVEVVAGALVNPIDVSSVESSTVMTREQIDAIAVPRNVTSVALLAPGTVKGDNRFGCTRACPDGLASIGGASVAENAYFVNGFNVTNIKTGLAFSQVPFEGIAEQQVKTGGYGAEYGRSLGGVVNVITQSGTNEWEFGANVVFQPKSLNDSDRFTYDPDRDGVYETKTSEQLERTVFNVDVGGPIIKDRLFMYLLVQASEVEKFGENEGGSDYYKSSTPQGLLKLDWHINDKNLLELTAFRDETETDGKVYNRTPGDLSWGGGELAGTSYEKRGGDNYIGRWTGYLTDTFTLSALYGHGEYSRATSDSNGETCPRIVDTRTVAVVGPLGVQGCWVADFKGVPDAGDTREAYRVDAEWSIGDHTVKFGLDNEEFETVDGAEYSGGVYYRYDEATPGDTLTGNGGIVPAGVTEVVRERTFVNGGTFLTKNSAWYVEDSWNVTDNFLVYAGFRSESFENLNSLGGSFINVKDTEAPRLGFSWDIEGDSTKKLFANLGRYYIPVYSNTNVRLAGQEYDAFTWYTFDSIDPVTGAPGGLAALGPLYVTSDGEVKDPRTVVANGLSPMYQDEFILGYQQQLTNNWTAGLRGIYRELQSGMDDVCNYEEPYNWAISEGYAPIHAARIAGAINNCFLANPGQDLSLNVDLGNNGILRTINIPAAAMGFERAKRTYTALELLVEGRFDNWFLQGSYTWSESKGNTEGYVKSDNGQDDAGITQDFDYPGLMDGATGYLPNDRRHSVKLFGSYSFNDEWQVGGNLIAQSGRPRNCFGIYPPDGPESSYPSGTGAQNYGVASFYCGTGTFPETLHPRGTTGRVPWAYSLDAQVVYHPEWAEGVSMRLAVNNVFDSKDYYRQVDDFETESGSELYLYGAPRGFVPPRNVTFQIGYQF